MDINQIVWFLFWIAIIGGNVVYIVHLYQGIIRKEVRLPLASTWVNEKGVIAICFGTFQLILTVIVLLITFYIGYVAFFRH